MPEFYIADIEEISENKILTKLTPYGSIGVTKIFGEIIAFQDECTHDGASFDNASIEGREIVCPRHGARFDLFTGMVKKLPATENIEIFRIKIESNKVFVIIE